jgi:hypothetical protein
MKIKACDFSAVKYAFARVVHNNEHIQIAHPQMLQLMMMIVVDRGVTSTNQQRLSGPK